MKTDNQPNDGINSFDEIVRDLMKQSLVTTDGTTKQITRVEKEWINGKEFVVQRNVKIPIIKGEKNADKVFSIFVNILSCISSKKISQEAGLSALQKNMVEKGRTRLLKTHTRRETNPALITNVTSRGCVINEICGLVNLNKKYVQPILRLIMKYGLCDTFQVLDKEKLLEELNNQKQELEEKKTRTPEEEKKLKKLIRKIPDIYKKCRIHILANDKTENCLSFMDGRPDKEQMSWSGIFGELATGDYA